MMTDIPALPNPMLSWKGPDISDARIYGELLALEGIIRFCAHYLDEEGPSLYGDLPPQEQSILEGIGYTLSMARDRLAALSEAIQATRDA